MPSSLVTTGWLADHLADPDLVLLDGSFVMPGVTPTAAEDYAAGHIPGARFFDIDAIADPGRDLPHMLPDAAAFQTAMRALGLSDDSHVVVYDRPGLMSAGRVWWSLRCFGFDRVSILDGGLRTWLAEGRALSREVPVPRPGDFHARLRPQFLRSQAEVLANIASGREAVIDARSAPRFAADVPEPRAGLRAGHIPGSRNLPYDRLSDPATGRILPPAALRQAFEAAGLDLARPVIASCGSGVTACALAFALHLLGKEDVAVYDGAWAEWGRPGDWPVATGPAQAAQDDR